MGISRNTLYRRLEK
ncbi:hypothetical protein BHT19_0008595 [[Kluyvera] intestini]|nr:hypothetical protein BHT19_0008595 [[Kluyvera] intestini]